MPRWNFLKRFMGFGDFMYSILSTKFRGLNTSDATKIKLVNNLIKSCLGGISRNDLWVLQISCILSYPPNFMARTHLILQKLTRVPTGHISRLLQLVCVSSRAQKCFELLVGRSVKKEQNIGGFAGVFHYFI